MIWAAVFLLCTPHECMSVGSPLFRTKDECLYSTQTRGINSVNQKFPNHVVVAWMCVSFGGQTNDI
jgi:hypothetical protein